MLPRTLLSLLLFPLVASAQPVVVKGVRVWPAPDHTRIVFDTNAPVTHDAFVLDRPDRLVIDLRNTHFNSAIPALPQLTSTLRGIRRAARGNDTRVVLDLRQAVRFTSFLLAPNSLYGHRLVIDIQELSIPCVAPSHSKPPTLAVTKLAEPIPKIMLEPTLSGGRLLMIAIDPGHGGEDPGAIGPHGVREKDVVLQIGRRLARLINAEPGMQSILTRDGDYYVDLRQRVRKAQRVHADLFVSIHADSSPKNTEASGASVYTLSEKGATSEEARRLAEQENTADLLGGVRLDDKDGQLASVMLNMSMNRTVELSQAAARKVLRQLIHLGPTHRATVQSAGFLVLKAPDIPGMLVETAYISNPVEEARLRNPQQQEEMAHALLSGIRNYFLTNAPADTWMARNNRASN